LLGLAGPAAAQAVDYSLYADLLKKYVQGEAVDYAGLKGERAKLDRFLTQMAQAEPERLGRAEQMAFYINAYNAWTLWLILTKYPELKSIKDLGGLLSGPWSQKIVRLKHGVLTLDEVEHDILRPRFKDPRVHFAVNCASKGCPPLWPEPFTGARLDEQLDQATAAVINDPRRAKLENGVLYLNKVMDWYAGDFPRDQVSFVKKYARGELKRRLEALGDKVRVDYLDYDWSLNDK
jgi:hypothetical protein